MSSLWTPEGERPIRRDGPTAAARPGRSAERFEEVDPFDDDNEAGDLDSEMAQLQADLADAPVEDVIANHCIGLFQLAAVHLSQRPPQFTQATLAIDAMGAMVDALGGRLGANEATLQDALAQIRLAFVQIKAGEA